VGTSSRSSAYRQRCHAIRRNPHLARPSTKARLPCHPILCRIGQVLERVRADDGVRVLVGGGTDDTEGWFVQPTVVQADHPRYEVFTTEYFGPILGVLVYDDGDYDQVVGQVADESAYALTGSVVAQDRQAIEQATERLRFAAGNFDVNDKPTGAVVGQQPFGGARVSGTNDKAGSMLNLLRWVSPRAIKETFVPPTDYRYPHMG
jgi:1-pyrroline-5-carboxylate dehydrogenase